MPSKPGDLVNAQIQSFKEIVITIPADGAVIERYRAADGSIVQILKVRAPLKEDGERGNSPVSLTLEASSGDGGDPPAGYYPHTNIAARKQPDDWSPFSFYTEERDLDETIDLAIPPTEPDES
jgi:hypothetical protein